MKNKLNIAIAVILCADIACTVVFGQHFYLPPPPEPVSIHICGPQVVASEDIATASAAVIADGCPDVQVRQPMQLGGNWVVYGTRVVVGMEIQLKSDGN